MTEVNSGITGLFISTLLPLRDLKLVVKVTKMLAISHLFSFYGISTKILFPSLLRQCVSRIGDLLASTRCQGKRTVENDITKPK